MIITAVIKIAKTPERYIASRAKNAPKDCPSINSDDKDLGDLVQFVHSTMNEAEYIFAGSISDGHGTILNYSKKKQIRK